jgi:hypothetical protein
MCIQLCRGPARLSALLTGPDCREETQEPEFGPRPMEHGTNPQLREWLMGPDDMLSTHSSADARCSGRTSVGVVGVETGHVTRLSPPHNPFPTDVRTGQENSVTGVLTPPFPHLNGSAVRDGKFYKSHWRTRPSSPSRP